MNSKAKVEGEQRNVRTPLLDFALALRLTFKAWPVIAAATIGLCFITQHIAGALGFALNEQANLTVVRSMFLHVFDSWRNFGVVLLNVSLILAICPILEELIFRGLLYRLPASRFGKVAVFTVVSSGLFSAAHYLMQPWPDNAFLALFFFGLAQCWLYKKTGHLWCAMLNHALFNLTNLVLLFLIGGNQ